MKRKNGLNPFPGFDYKATVLILGSFAGEESLEAGEYYANKRNYFWRIISQILDQPIPETYAAKKTLLRKYHICLWDVVESCCRAGSLDKSIKSPHINAIEVRLDDYPTVKAVFLNGKKAGRWFHRAFPYLSEKVYVDILPSTSPANAGMGYADKVRAWRGILKFIKG